ncbi:MAG: M20/M25/M40 family metallo-hydrolase [Acidimicrobiia bacterium]|nr:MAG: M20/M25/M40 family metallo-hydrolase [Acidimicrobiia bacterium]
MSVDEAIVAAVDEDRLVTTATELVAIPSPTGNEEEAARYLYDELEKLGLETRLQHIEEGRANAVARLPGAGGGRSLMFNGHLDTSYSGDEPWLDGPGYKPDPIIRDGVILGLGIMNMKGAVACYVEAVRAILDAGVTLAGDLVVAGVAGEIEKAQWGEFQGAEFRGYGVGTRHLVTHGVLTEACILGEPSEEKLVLGHWGTMWVRISTSGPFFHTAFSLGRLDENAIMRMPSVLDRVRPWIAEWEKRGAYRGEPGVVNVGAIGGGFPWRVSRTPASADLFLDVRVPPTMPMLEAIEAFNDLVRGLDSDHPEFGISSEVYVTAGGAEIDEAHDLVSAADASHTTVFGSPPERSYVRWASDASTLSRYGVACLNYGPISSALPGPEGESVPIASLVNIARSYALTAARFCGVKP